MNELHFKERQAENVAQVDPEELKVLHERNIALQTALDDLQQNMTSSTDNYEKEIKKLAVENKALNSSLKAMEDEVS